MRSRDFDIAAVLGQDQSHRLQLESLQVLRAIAALMVVIFHLNIHTLPDTFEIEPLWFGLNMGYAGVDIFFVLSGFIMLFKHESNFDQPEQLWPYLYARVTRIFPVFWIVMFGVVALRNIAYQSSPELQSVLISALLLPITDQHVLGVQWTLSFEMLFYLAFSLFILNARLGIAVMALWFGACIILAGVEKTGIVPNFFFSPYNILFLLGIIAAKIWRNIGKLDLPFLLVGIVLFFAVGLSEVFGFINYSHSPRTVLYGIAALLMICGAASLEHRGQIRPPTFLVFLGNASYAIYLVHITAMSAASRVLKQLSLVDLPVILLAIFALLSAIFVGSLVHIVIEKPIMRFLKARGPISH